MSTRASRRALAFFDVDTQRDFLAPTGRLYVRGARLLGPRIRSLVACAAERGFRLFSSVDAHPADDPEFSMFPPHCLAGAPGQQKVRGTLLADAVTVGARPALRKRQIAEALEHRQVVFEKQSFDVFDNPNAERVVAASGAGRFVVFGVATDYCVRSAALGLRRRGYGVAVVEDAIRGVARDTTAAALAEMRAAGVRFRTTAQVLRRPNA